MLARGILSRSLFGTERIGTESVAKPDLLTTGIEDRISELLREAGPLEPILDYMASTRGKRMRPLCVIWSSSACAVSSGATLSPDHVLDVAALFELVHMASLVHDDIIDGAMVRRGVPTPHVIWGIHRAVLAGDYLFTRANKVALAYSDLGIPELINEAIELTCEGEVAQDERLYDCEISRSEYMAHICKKTAALFGAACRAGAALARVADSVSGSMLRFGIELGCAFQIMDDVRDLTSDPVASGKPTCNDLRSGVLTLPLIHAMEGPGKDLIRQGFAQKNLDDSLVSSIKSACERDGSIDRAKADARRLARLAASRLSCLPPSYGKSALQALASAVVEHHS
ncbi:MAG: polyprenyl synthetase family protein [Bacillota bacterium]